MKIKIKDNAREIYVGSFVKSPMPINWQWADNLEAIQGMTLEVETEYLFKDQFNTVPIPGVSPLGLRITQDVVAEVIDDERPGKARCGWCGKTTGVEVCHNCGKKEYLEAF